MKFSILVPVYNVEKYLEQCVESLLNQTYNEAYEIILVDDGSTDSSGSICDRYAEKYPEKVKVTHKKNEGLVSARQAGIEAATGEFCLFVDSDDFVENRLIETIHSAINRNPKSEMIIYSFHYFENQKIRPRKVTLAPDETVFEGNNKKELYESLICSPTITALWIKAVKTDILKNDPTDYSLYYDKNMAEDLFRSIHILTEAPKIVYINEPLYFYRTNNESISKSFRPETIDKKNILYVYDRFIEYLPIWGMDTNENRKKLNTRWLNEVIYTFSKYYENAQNVSERKTVLNYDWDTMLPEDLKNNLNNQEHSLPLELYMQLKKKQFFRIYIYFLKIKIYKKLRILKARLFKNEK